MKIQDNQVGHRTGRRKQQVQDLAAVPGNFDVAWDSTLRNCTKRKLFVVYIVLYQEERVP
jgi:hypothetical protein